MKFDKKFKRLNRYFLCISVEGLWYDRDNKCWVEKPTGEFSNHKRCKTVRAFRRALRKNPNIRGKAHLINSLIGIADVHG